MKLFTSSTPKIAPLFLGFSLLCCSCFINAQTKLPGKAIQLVGGYSKHGSGDFRGIVFGGDYINYRSRKFSLDYNFKATINHGKETILVYGPGPDDRSDQSIRFTTAGVQIGVNAGWSLIRNRHHEFMISLGGFGRYQSASNGSDGYAIYSPIVTGWPAMLISYNNTTPQNTYSAGGIFQFQYNYTFNNKIYIGLLPGFQTDTNGDAIPQVALSVGRRLY